MSGIAAVLNLDGSAVPRSEIERMLNVLRPYGPDQQKYLIRGNAAFVSCIHQLTPEDIFERQPLVTSNRFVTLFDGRIDNRSELAEALGIDLNDLLVMPDSMLAFRLFDRWGAAGFERIVGVFGTIIADLEDHSLICVRDQLGLRSLHYHRTQDRFAIATCPEALFALSWVPRIWNADRVVDTLVNRGLSGETTYFREVFRVPHASFVRVRGELFSKEQYWNPENIADIRFKRDDEYVEAFKERLEAAIRVRMRSRKELCAGITGGLDSSSIAVIAANILAANGKSLNTYTAVPEAGYFKPDTAFTYYDETPYVKLIAEANGNIVPHFIPPSKKPVLEQIAEQMRIGGVPSGGIMNGLWVMDIVSAARAAGHDVMLSGDMGNHTMSYDGRALPAQLLLSGRWWRLLIEIMRCRAGRTNMIRGRLLAPITPAPLYGMYKRWRRQGKLPWHDRSAIDDEFATKSGVIDRAAREYLPFDAPPPRNGKLARANDINCYCEAADWFAKLRAGFGVDIRAPAFDRQLVEFCLGVPEEQYLHRGEDRWLIRRAMQGCLPNTVVASRRRGAQAADWYPRLTRDLAEIRREVHRLAGSREVTSVIDTAKLIEIVENWPTCEPSRVSPEGRRALVALPTALAAAFFIENVTGSNTRP